GDVEVQRLLALVVDEGVELALDLPQHQRAEDITEGDQQPGEGREVAEHRPLAGFLTRGGAEVLFFHGALRGGGGISRPGWRAAARTVRACPAGPVPAWHSALPA